MSSRFTYRASKHLRQTRRHPVSHDQPWFFITMDNWIQVSSYNACGARNTFEPTHPRNDDDILLSFKLTSLYTQKHKYMLILQWVFQEFTQWLPVSHLPTLQTTNSKKCTWSPTGFNFGPTPILQPFGHFANKHGIIFHKNYFAFLMSCFLTFKNLFIDVLQVYFILWVF